MTSTTRLESANSWLSTAACPDAVRRITATFIKRIGGREREKDCRHPWVHADGSRDEQDDAEEGGELIAHGAKPEPE